MENQDWFRDIENTMSDYLNEYMNTNAAPRSHNPTGFGDANNNPRHYNQARTREDVSEHRLYLLINEFQQDYYASMRLYQENMRDMIQLLREFRTIPQHNPNHSFPFPDIHTAQQQTAPQIPQPAMTQIPSPAPRTDNLSNFPLATTSFAYFIQPLVTENEGIERLTDEQIERAIERIVYDASMSNSYNESNTNNTGEEVVADRCPICLEDFQIGEEVVRIRVCGHIFKQPGLLRWFQRNNHCPVCRGNVVENQPSPEESSPSENIQEQPQTPPEQTRRLQNRPTPSQALNNLIGNHIRNPLVREFSNLIQTMAQGNQDGRAQYTFFDFSLNPHL